MTTYMQFEGPNFIMQAPTNWFITSSVQFQALFAAPISGLSITPNLAVSLQKMQANVTLSEITTAARRNQTQDYPEYKVLTESESTDTLYPGFERSYTWKHLEKNVIVLQRQRMYLANSILFSLTASRPNDSTLAYYDEIFAYMMDSIEIIRPNVQKSQ